MERVNFICQRCLMPIRLDDSFKDIDEHTLAELSLPIYNSRTIETSDCSALMFDQLSATEAETVTSGQTLVGASHRPSPQQSGTHCTDESRTRADPDCDLCTSVTCDTRGIVDSGDPETRLDTCSRLFDTLRSTKLSHQVQVAAHLFDKLSSSTTMDHPMCVECADYVIENLQSELKQISSEASTYCDYITLMKRTRFNTAEHVLNLQKDTELLKSEQEHLSEEIDTLLAEKKMLSDQLREEEEECRKMEAEEEELWREYCQYRYQLITSENDYISLFNKVEFSKKHLQKLKSMNIFNAVFHIWHNGHFGTINNFRLGRLPNIPVEWSEINAAWGQTVLLLNALARHVGLEFSKYRLVACASHSYIVCLNTGKELPLHCSGGLKFIWNSKFDAAMVAFTECLQELQEMIESTDNSFMLPYRVIKGKLEDLQSNCTYSVKIQLNSEQHWTKAMKFMLTNLKWMIAWVRADSNVESLPIDVSSSSDTDSPVLCRL